MSSRLLARLLVAATGTSVAACGGATGLEDTSADNVWVAGQAGSGTGGSTNAGGSNGGTSNAGGSNAGGSNGGTSNGGTSNGGTSNGGSAAGGTTAAGGATSTPFCHADGCVAGSWCATSENGTFDVCHCSLVGQAACHVSPPSLGSQIMLCYEEPSGGACLALGDSSLQAKLGALYPVTCGVYASSGPIVATTSADVPACCYLSSVSGCTGRPIDIDGTTRVASLVRSRSWA